MKDQIPAIFVAYDRLQANEDALQAKHWREEAKWCLINFVPNMMQSKLKVAKLQIIWLETENSTLQNKNEQ